MKLIKYDTLILLVIFAMLWMFACTHEWNPPIEPPPPPPIEEVEEILLIDSCVVMDIDTPAVRCITVADVTREIAERATISWRESSQVWIDNFAVVDSSHIKILIDIVGENMGYDSVRWIDKSVIDGAMIHLDFTICFVNFIGVFDIGSEDWIYFEFDLLSANVIDPLAPDSCEAAAGILNDRIWVRKDNIGSIYPPDESTASEMIQLIQPSYQILGFYGVDLDSAGMVPVWEHGLSNCKGFAKWDGRGHAISAEILDQASYQQITVIQ